MTDREFLTQAIIERMDFVFQRDRKESLQEEKAARLETEKQFRHP